MFKLGEQVDILRPDLIGTAKTATVIGTVLRDGAEPAYIVRAEILPGLGHDVVIPPEFVASRAITLNSDQYAVVSEQDIAPQLKKETP